MRILINIINHISSLTPCVPCENAAMCILCMCKQWSGLHSLCHLKKTHKKKPQQAPVRPISTKMHHPSNFHQHCTRGAAVRAIHNLKCWPFHYRVPIGPISVFSVKSQNADPNCVIMQNGRDGVKYSLSSVMYSRTEAWSSRAKVHGWTHWVLWRHFECHLSRFLQAWERMNAGPGLRSHCRRGWWAGKGRCVCVLKCDCSSFFF